MYFKTGDIRFGDEKVLQKNTDIEADVIELILSCCSKEHSGVTSESTLKGIVLADLSDDKKVEMESELEDFFAEIMLAVSEKFEIEEITDGQMKDWKTVGNIVTFVILNRSRESS